MCAIRPICEAPQLEEAERGLVLGLFPPAVLSIVAYSRCAKYARQSAIAVMSVASTAAKGWHRKP